MNKYIICHAASNRMWEANAGEALIYCSDDLYVDYAVYRLGGVATPIIMAELLADIFVSKRDKAQK